MNLYEEYSKRCLYKSLTFLKYINYKSIDFSINIREQDLITNFNQRNYNSIIKSICYYKCNCCNLRIKFLGDYSQIIMHKIRKQKINHNLKEDILQKSEDDSFILFLKAIVNQEKRVEYLLAALIKDNYFFDAFEMLLMSSDYNNFSFIQSTLENNIEDELIKSIYFAYFYIIRLLKTSKLDIYIEKMLKSLSLYEIVNDEKNSNKILFNNEYNNTKQENWPKNEHNIKEVEKDIFYENNFENFLNLNNLNQSFKNNNIFSTSNSLFSLKNNFSSQKSHDYVPKLLYCLLGGVFYNKKKFTLSALFFEKNLSYPDFCMEFMDMYSHILYINSDQKKTALLSELLVITNPYRSETMVSIANYYSLRKNHTKAIEYLEKSVVLDEKHASNFTLMGNEYSDLNMHETAIKCYLKSLKCNKNDYRAYHGIGSIKKAMGLDLEAAFFFKKAVEIHSDDSYFWLEYGRALETIDNHFDAINAYQRAYEEGDIDGLLKMGDLYKGKKDYKKAIKCYEDYVLECKKINRECSKIIECIENFYRIIN